MLLTPVWVTSANMASTVVKDGAVKKADLCITQVAAACTAAGHLGDPTAPWNGGAP